MSRSLARTWWLGVATSCVGVFVGLPLLAPLLLATGFGEPAGAIYAAYEYVCHQWAFRSYFLLGAQSVYSSSDLVQLVGADHAHGFVGSPELGYKLAFCQRCAAIYAAVLLAGFAYAHLRDRIRPLGLTAYALLALPMALDGFSQAFGWRESGAELRTLTGVLFGVASVWLIYPRVDAALAAPAPARDVRLREAAA